VEGTFSFVGEIEGIDGGCVDKGVLTDAFVQKIRECISKHFNPVCLIYY
jgi:hypothetical protein